MDAERTSTSIADRSSARKTVEAARLAAEARRMGAAEFAARYPLRALVVEPLVGKAAVASPAFDPGTTDLDLGRARTAAFCAPPAVNPSARIFWVPEDALAIQIGRDPSCELALPHPLISRVHATIRREG